MNFARAVSNPFGQHVRPTLLALCTTLALALSNQSLASGNQLPDIGTAGLSALTLEKEREIGDQAMRQLRATYPIIYDPVMQEYLDTLGYRLISTGSTPIHPFTFFLINDTSINAFAFFGGHVGVHSGLFLAAVSESEFASVLAHEIAHVNQRHLARRLERNMNLQPATLGAALGSILLAILAPQAGIAALQTTLATQQQMTINFTRKNEAEADRIGMQNLVAAGFDPYAMPNFFGKLAAEYRFAAKAPAFLLTHPLPESRVADTKLRAQQYPKSAHPASINFQFAKARAEARYGDLTPAQVSSQLKHELFNPGYPNKEAIRYGLALAQLASGASQEAAKTIAPLAQKYKDNLFVVDAMTDIDLANGHASQAQQRLESFYQYMPDNQVIALNYANVLLQQGQMARCIEVIQHYQVNHPEDMAALGLLEDAFSKEGQIAKQYNVRADTLALMGQYEQAIAMLDRALRATPDAQHIELTKLQAKKRQLSYELRRSKSLR